MAIDVDKQTIHRIYYSCTFFIYIVSVHTNNLHKIKLNTTHILDDEHVAITFPK